MDWSRRSEEKEQLDAFVPAAEAERSLGDLRRVNAWLGGWRSLRRAVLPLLDGVARASLLDVGCGSADLPALLQRARPGLRAVGLDRKLLHLQLAPSGVARVVADVRALPFAVGSFDVVTASLFLHHFDSPEAVLVLRELFALSRRALVINDLHRARIPYYFGRAVFPLVFRSEVSVNDGLVSIQRAFKARELAELFERAGIRGVRVRQEFPYRLVAVAHR
jgi:ubiquinone/menaquinone biosynthesis C-methylase UbiE